MFCSGVGHTFARLGVIETDKRMAGLRQYRLSGLLLLALLECEYCRLVLTALGLQRFARGLTNLLVSLSVYSLNHWQCLWSQGFRMLRINQGNHSFYRPTYLNTS